MKSTGNKKGRYIRLDSHPEGLPRQMAYLKKYGPTIGRKVSETGEGYLQAFIPTPILHILGCKKGDDIVFTFKKEGDKIVGRVAKA